MLVAGTTLFKLKVRWWRGRVCGLVVLIWFDLTSHFVLPFRCWLDLRVSPGSGRDGLRLRLAPRPVGQGGWQARQVEEGLDNTIDRTPKSVNQTPTANVRARALVCVCWVSPPSVRLSSLMVAFESRSDVHKGGG